MTSPNHQYDALVADFVANHGAGHKASQDGAKRGFGANSLTIDGRIFAMLVADGLVVKLPATRVNELIEAGEGVRFDPGHGRLMKEWLAITSTSPATWRDVAREALDFVAGGRKRRT